MIIPHLSYASPARQLKGRPFVYPASHGCRFVEQSALDELTVHIVEAVGETDLAELRLEFRIGVVAGLDPPFQGCTFCFVPHSRSKRSKIQVEKTRSSRMAFHALPCLDRLAARLSPFHCPWNHPQTAAVM